MGRALQIALILIITWASAALYDQVRVPNSRLEVDSAARPQPLSVAASVATGREIGSWAPQAKPGPAEAEFKVGGRARSKTYSKGYVVTMKVPMQVATMIKKKNLEEVVEKYAKRYGVDEDLIWAVIRQESGFNPVAVSPKGAMGLMQLMPGTAALMGVSNPFDMEQNIAGGVKYLEQCLNQFDQDVPLALAAYNAGPATVAKYQGCPPFAETRQYVASILQAYAGEPIRADLRLGRVSYIVKDDLPASVYFRGLPWKIPIPSWKITAPKSRLGAPHWKVALSPF
jgi:hypothetical protein